MSGLVVMFAVTTLWMLYSVGKNEIDRQKNLKDLEHKFLWGTIWTWKYKFQMEEMLKIIYEKAGETDPQYIKDYEKIVESVNKKFTSNADELIKHLNETLGYKTEYQNWEEATRYIEKMAKTQETHESERRKTD